MARPHLRAFDNVGLFKPRNYQKKKGTKVSPPLVLRTRDYGIGRMDCGMEMRGKCGITILFLRAYAGRITRRAMYRLSLSLYLTPTLVQEEERERGRNITM